jgi:hypothetical protein
LKSLATSVQTNCQSYINYSRKLFRNIDTAVIFPTVFKPDLHNKRHFPKYGPKIILILDNTTFHKSKDVLAKISEEFPNFVLEFLPAYSPDYNIIELV